MTELAELLSILNHLHLLNLAILDNLQFCKKGCFTNHSTAKLENISRFIILLGQEQSPLNQFSERCKCITAYEAKI